MASVGHEAAVAMCSGVCSGAGHRLHPIQQAVASASPSSWIDGFASVDGDRLIVATLDGGAHALWHHLPVAAGDAVAYHPVAGVLSVRGGLLSVREL